MAFLSLHATGADTAQPASDRSLSPADSTLMELRKMSTATNHAAATPPAPANADAAAATNTADITAAPNNAATNTTITSTSTDAATDNAAANAGLQPKAGPANPDLSALSREELEARVKSLTQELASANADAESFREQYQDLKLRDEALGVEALTVDDQKLEDRLTSAMGELVRTEMKRREAVTLMGKLLDSTQKLLATAPKEDPAVRAEYEVATRAARAYLEGRDGSAIPIASSLDDGKIVDLNPDLNAVVLNLGKSQGVKEGMPFLIYRDSEEIGTVKVVLARDLISAAVIDSVKPKAAFKIGDRATVDARQ